MSELQSRALPILPQEAGAIGSGKRSGLVELLVRCSSFLQLYTHSQAICSWQRVAPFRMSRSRVEVDNNHWKWRVRSFEWTLT